MPAAPLIALGGVLIMALVNAAGYFVAWGSMRATVSALDSRVNALESEFDALKKIEITVARIETRLDGMAEAFRDLNDTIRWMRGPLPAEAPGPLASPRRRPAP